MSQLMHNKRRLTAVAALTLAAGLAYAPIAAAALPPVKHVFVVVEENESAATTFGANSPAQYLSQTLKGEGAYLSEYYGIGHNSLDNYIAMVSGQAPNALTSGDCPNFVNFASDDALAPNGQMTGEGCVYPSFVPTLMQQLDSAGLTWRAYEDSMGSDPARESGTCGHPTIGQPDNTEAENASPFDAYATRHDPFVYFHYVDDNTTECDADVVNISQLSSDLASEATTPNYVFVTPDLCDDGHDATCANGGPGGLAQADTYLKTIVPEITNSPAFKDDGLLIVTFDEAEGDDSSCCTEFESPYNTSTGDKAGLGGPGGGVIGAVLLSPYIKAGTTSSTPYNHYSMLATVEDIFGLSRLGEADCAAPFGADVFTNFSGVTAGGADPASSQCSVADDQAATATSWIATPQLSSLHLSRTSLKPGAKTTRGGALTIAYIDSQAALTKFTVERRAAGFTRHGSCVALAVGRVRPKHSHACKALVAVGSFTHEDLVGANSLLFTGHVGGRLLPVGAYELETLPSLAAAKGAELVTPFRVN